ncbi:MAG TPA: hypothetical protein VFP99_08025, partial [Chthoniobacterales bacterium]|nr:hypothetical protein [Chthoniobacterales bacterium]
MTNGISTRGSRILVGAIALMIGASATFAGTLIPLSPRLGGDNIQPVPPVSGGGPGGNNILANTANVYIGSTTGNLSTTGNWSLGHVPTVSEDAVFDGVSGTTGARHLDSASMTVGSFDVTAATGTFTVRNTTASTTSTITLGGAGSTGNSVSGTSTDLLFAATGSTFTFTGDNSTALLNLVLGQSGTFNAAGTMNISSVISDGGSGFAINKTGAGILLLSGANTYSGGL